MPDLSGLDVLTRAREEGIDTLFIVMTAQNTMANAIEATKRGAYDYLTKPFDLEAGRACSSIARSRSAASRATSQRLRGELRAAPRARHRPHAGHAGGLQGHRPRRARPTPPCSSRARPAPARSSSRRRIHYHSGAAAPFVALNCSAIPNELLESELFGYERGAFTGAVERRIGKFEAAAGGTLFLDEIAELPLGLQAKLLRVLQEREFTRVGGRDAIRADVRIVAATNQRPRGRGPRRAASARTSSSG